MCKYSDRTGYKCPHDKLDDSDYCIFHLWDDNKDADEFNKGINEILETDDDSINLNGFYFPPNSFEFAIRNFQNKISFYDAKFSGYANFDGATFTNGANFQEVEFKGIVNFRGATFTKGANFGNAKFKGDVDFQSATFKGDVDFVSAKFKGDVDFVDAKFLVDDKLVGDANFQIAIFSKNVNFKFADFSVNADFAEVEFSGKFIFIPVKSKGINFEGTYFSDGARIKADLSKCSFANSNIERVDMTYSTWVVDDKPKDSYKILEQRQGELSSDWIKLEGIYRRLKQSYQQFGDANSAGKFYYLEMECKRNKSGRYDKMWYKIFKMSCGYGEKPEYVLLSSIVIIFISSVSFFYWGIGLETNDPNLPLRLINYDFGFNFQWVVTNFSNVFNDWLNCLYTSTITFTTLGYGDVRPIGYSRIVASVEAGIGIFMTSLFIFVFTRKMLR